jgi:hypothetical protein
MKKKKRKTFQAEELARLILVLGLEKIFFYDQAEQCL